MSTTNHHHTDLKWKSEIKRLAEDNAKLLNLVRSLSDSKKSELSQKDEQIDTLKSEMKSLRVQLGLAQDELKTLRENGGASSTSVNNDQLLDSLRAQVTELKDKLEDTNNFNQNLQTENSRFKMQVKTAQQKVRSADEDALSLKNQLHEAEAELEETRNQLKQQQMSLENTMANLNQMKQEQEQQKNQHHVDPNNNNSNNDPAEVEKKLKDLEDQRDYFMAESERLKSHESRDISELQQWSNLLKKLVASLRQVKSKWEVETEGGSSENMKLLSEALTVNVSPEDSYTIVDNLSRVSAQVKKSQNQTSQILSSTMNHQNAVDVDNFSVQLRPAVIEFLKLVHGVFADAAFLWAMVKKYKQLEQEWSRKEAELAPKKKGWFN